MSAKKTVSKKPAPKKPAATPAKKAAPAVKAKKPATAKAKPQPVAKAAPKAAAKPSANRPKAAASKPKAKAASAASKTTAASKAKPAKKPTAKPVAAAKKPAPAAKAKPAAAHAQKAKGKKEGAKAAPATKATATPAKATATPAKAAQPKKPAAPTTPVKAKAQTASAATPAKKGKAPLKKAKHTSVKSTSSSSKQNTPAPTPELDAKTKELLLSARKRTASNTPPRALRSRGAPIVFTMEDVAQALAKKQAEATPASTAEAPAVKVVKKQEIDLDAQIPQESRVHSAVSLSDILGFNPAAKKSPNLGENGQEVPRKWSRYYKALIELRASVSSGLEQHTAETLKRSNRDDSGDLSSYGQHLADAGTDTFDRDFALSMVSSEQEALFEINEAIRRIFNGSYGLCEITGEPIAAERLEAVPFTRYSLEGQKELEKNKRQKIQRGGVFTDNDESLAFEDDDN